MKKLLFTIIILTSLSGISAPFKMFLDITNSKGKQVKILAEGDEFDAVFETIDGYSLLSKDNTEYYYYALKDGDSLKISDVEVGEETETIPSTLDKHLRDTSEKHDKEIQKRIEQDELINSTQKNWEDLKRESEVVEDSDKNWFSKAIDYIISLFKKDKEPLSTPPKTHTVGNIIGVTIMVDFPIKNSDKTEAETKHPDIDWAKVNRSINDEKSDSDINPTVRQFYKEASCGRLNLTNEVINYVLLDKPRSYYDDVTKDCGTCGRLLIKDVFEKIKKMPNYESEIYPIFQRLSYNDKNKIYSLSIMFAGGSAKKWSQGLWAHKSTTSVNIKITSVDGKKISFSTYQISPLSEFYGDYIYMGTFIHESGHMVCSFPDLYDYDKKSKGAGYYSYMATMGPADPYLAYKAGWIDPIEIVAQSTLLVMPPDYKTVFKYTNPSNSKEYYLLKYTKATGPDREMPGKGIIIYRCNESGSNTHSSYIGKTSTQNKYRRSFELSILQADGKYDLERNIQSGEQEDYWTDEDSYLDDTTVPNTSWKNNSLSSIKISNFKLYSNYATCLFETALPAVKVKTTGFDGKYDKKIHRITVTKISPTSGVTIKYSKTKDGKYSSTNPSYSKIGEYTTYFTATKKGYLSTNGCEKVIIRDK